MASKSILQRTAVTPQNQMMIPASDPDAASGIKDIAFSVASLLALLQAGVTGSQIYSVQTSPSNALGNNGDYCINTVTGYLFGPKQGGIWPTVPIALTSAAEAANALAISNEVTRAELAEAALNTAITSETTNRQNAVSGEATARASGDVTNANAIAAETVRAEAAEGALTTNLASEITNRGNAISAEAATRAAADATNAAAAAAAQATASAALVNTTAAFGTAWLAWLVTLPTAPNAGGPAILWNNGGTPAYS